MTSSNEDKAHLRQAVSHHLHFQHEKEKILTYQTIFSDAILGMLNAPAESVNGLLELDEDFLRKYYGVSNFSKYSVIPGTSPRRIMPKELPTLTVAEQDDEGTKLDSTALRQTKL